jgi:DNA-3-methyladenine glycosylase
MLCPDRSFYARSTYIVANDLIGKRLVRIKPISDNKLLRLSGIIVETEAYGFRNDHASHAFNGPTLRNQIMFGDVGKAYVYFIYGNHYCLNISAHSKKSKAGAVLVRALEPVEGVETMKFFRRTSNELLLVSGPGRLSQAFSISKDISGMDVTDAKSELHVEYEGYGALRPTTISTSRIGISRSLNKRWRFVYGYAKGRELIMSKYASRRH